MIIILIQYIIIARIIRIIKGKLFDWNKNLDHCIPLKWNGICMRHVKCIKEQQSKSTGFTLESVRRLWRTVLFTCPIDLHYVVNTEYPPQSPLSEVAELDRAMSAYIWMSFCRLWLRGSMRLYRRFPPCLGTIKTSCRIAHDFLTGREGKERLWGIRAPPSSPFFLFPSFFPIALAADRTKSSTIER